MSRAHDNARRTAAHWGFSLSGWMAVEAWAHDAHTLRAINPSWLPYQKEEQHPMDRLSCAAVAIVAYLCAASTLDQLDGVLSERGVEGARGVNLNEPALRAALRAYVLGAREDK